MFYASKIDTCKNIQKFVEENNGFFNHMHPGLGKELRKARRKLEICEASRNNNPCIAIFGASQVGKSYLADVLPPKKGKKLRISIGEVGYNFDTCINLTGDGEESTGIVTRFSSTSDGDIQAAFPVKIKLMTEMDLVKCFTNGFYRGINRSDNGFDYGDTLKDIRDCVQKIKKGLGNVSNLNLADDDVRRKLADVEDLREYIEKFKGVTYCNALLDSVFFVSFEKLYCSNLDISCRIKLYSLIWAQDPCLTNMFAKLLRGLEKVNFAREAFLPLDSLIDKEKAMRHDKTILDVKRIDDLLVDDSDELSVRYQDEECKLPRSVVAALAAELVLQVEEPGELLAVKGSQGGVDLLDFPGYRSRQPDAGLDNKGYCRVFLRGKVAYLFQRYTERLEAFGLIFCIFLGNQEVSVDMGQEVCDWIVASHGKSRSSNDVRLFVACTKFDEKIKIRPTNPINNPDRFSSFPRNLREYQRDGTMWLDDWADEKKFSNTFIVCHLSCQKNVENICAEDLDKLKGFFIKSEFANFFEDKEKAWDKFITDDCGNAYLREKVAAISWKDCQQKQLDNTAKEICDGICEKLRVYHGDGDAAKQKVEREKLVAVLKDKFRTHLDKHGALLRDLSVSDIDVYHCLEKMSPDSRIYSDKLTDHVNRYWNEKVHAFCNNQDWLAEHGLDMETYNKFLNVIIEGWDKKLQELQNVFQEILDKITSFDDTKWKIAYIASRVINKHIMCPCGEHLGRPCLDGNDLPILEKTCEPDITAWMDDFINFVLTNNDTKSLPPEEQGILRNLLNELTNSM